MKISLKKSGLLVAAGILSTASFAQSTKEASIEGTTPLGSATQYRTWSIGVGAGVTSLQNIAKFNNGGYDKLDWNLGYSAYIKKQISPSF